MRDRCRRIQPSLALFFALVGCGKGGQVLLGSVHVKSSLIEAGTGGRLAVLPEDSADLAGTLVQIPPNALSQDTKITIGVARDSSILHDDGEPAGIAVSFGPDGTTFATPARITIPFGVIRDLRRVRIYARQANGATSVLLPNQLFLNMGEKLVSFDVQHFTDYQCGNASDACTGVRCADNVTCRNGECTRAACEASECGPAPQLALQCQDGSTAESVCDRGEKGVCRWGFVCPGSTEPPCVSPQCPCASGQCPCEPGQCGSDPCTAQACGPEPLLPNYTCPDGETVGGPTGECRRSTDGSCGWVIASC